MDRLRAGLVGRYTIERQLGRGGMATVYLAVDVEHQRQVALKLLHPEFAAVVGPERFLREIDIAATLSNPHILPLYDSGQVDGLLYYVMPYVSGESLQDRLQRETQLPIDDALAITKDIAAGLAYAHGQGLVHRDIKPGNILLDGDTAVLADFGIARAVDVVAGEELTDSGIVIGTPEYMSPEQGQGHGKVDSRSDIYSLGCVLYEMLAGEPPFTGPTAQVIIARHQHEAPRSLTMTRPTVPASVEFAVESALAKVPADRPGTAGRFVEMLDESVPVRATKRRRYAALASAVGILTVMTWLLAPWQWLTPNADLVGFPAERVAVLYLHDVSSAQQLGYLAAGLTHDLIDRLGAVKQLKVISPEGVRQFRDGQAPPDSIATALEVGTIVAGTVDTADGLLVLRVTLIEAATGEQLNAETLVRPWQEVLSLREDLIDEVSRSLRERVGRVVLERRRAEEALNPEAWRLVQGGRELWQDAIEMVHTNRDSAAAAFLQQADSFLRRAIHMAPEWNYPLVLRGWIAHGLFLMAQTSGDTGEFQAVAQIRRGLEFAERALAEDPESAEARELRGSLRYDLWLIGEAERPDETIEAARVDLWAAVEARPNSGRAWYTLSKVMLGLGRFDEADQLAHRALEADAYLTNGPSIVSTLFFATLFAQRYDEAGAWCKEGLRRYSGDVRFAECRLLLLAWHGRGKRAVDSAWKEVATLMQFDSLGMLEDRRFNHPLLAAMVVARTGWSDSARSILEHSKAARPVLLDQRRFGIDEAYVWILLSEWDSAMSRLEDDIAYQPAGRTFIGKHPWFATLHDQPAFRDLVGLTETDGP